MIRKLSVDDLRPGMVVARMPDDIWMRHPLVYNEPGPIRDLEHLALIRDAGFLETFVRSDSIVGRVEPDLPGDVARGERGGNGARPSPLDNERPEVALEEELRVAKAVYGRALSLAHDLVREVSETGRVDYAASRAAVGSVIESVSRNPSALTCLANLSHHDDYTYTHCVDVAALAVVYGRYLGMVGERLVELGLAGMFHDLGKTGVDKAIITKPGRLDAGEFTQMKRHPSLGRAILERQGGVPEAVVRGVAEHHEKFDGHGYPAGLQGSEISEYGRMLALADVFDALTSDRSYRAAMTADKALSLMYGLADKDFAGPDLQGFIKCLGIYPVGSLVRLSDGSMAVVCEHRPSRLLEPVVKRVRDAADRDIEPERLDLSEPPAVGAGDLRITEGLSARKLGLDVGRWLG